MSDSKLTLTYQPVIWLNESLLAEYSQDVAAGSAEVYWQSYWSNRELSTYVRILDKSSLFKFVQKRLPYMGKILEAGCGLSPWVILLNQLKYSVVGIDIVQSILLRAKKIANNLQINVADVCNLPFPDDTFDAYLSVGVIEHFQDGPHNVLSEAKRVLKSNGVLFVAVPFSNIFKRKRATNVENKAEYFHQYVFTLEQITKILDLYGYVVTDFLLFDQVHGILSELFAFNYGNIEKRSWRSRFARVLHYLLRKCSFLIPPKWFAHMIIVSAKQKK